MAAIKTIFGIVSTRNQPHMFGIGTDSTLYLNWRNIRGEWSGWIPDWNKAPKMSGVFGIDTTDNQPHMFGIGTESTLYLNWRNTRGEWSGWIPDWNKAPKMSGVFGMETTDNLPHIFGIGTDRTLYLNWRNTRGEWSGWIPDWDKAPKMSGVFGMETTDNLPHIFGIGTDSTLYLNWRNIRGEWSGWIPDWDKAPKMSSVFALEMPDNQPHIFGIGTDKTLYLNWRNTRGEWSGWLPNWFFETLIGYAVPLSWPLNWLDHTYVKGLNDGVEKFSWNCWGRKDGGTAICQGEGSLSVANCIAQHQPPESSGFPSGECTGLMEYMKNGVCHQAANRILWPAGITVCNAKGYGLSRFLFGTYGTDAAEWFERKKRCSGQFIAKTGDTAMNIYLTKVNELYLNRRNATDEQQDAGKTATSLIEDEMKLTVEYRLGAVPACMAELSEAQKTMLAEKAKIDERYTNKKISEEDYFKEISDQMYVFSKRCSDLLGEESYVRLFGEKPLTK